MTSKKVDSISELNHFTKPSNIIDHRQNIGRVVLNLLKEKEINSPASFSSILWEIQEKYDLSSLKSNLLAYHIQKLLKMKYIKQEYLVKERENNLPKSLYRRKQYSFYLITKIGLKALDEMGESPSLDSTKISERIDLWKRSICGALSESDESSSETLRAFENLAERLKEFLLIEGKIEEKAIEKVIQGFQIGSQLENKARSDRYYEIFLEELNQLELEKDVEGQPEFPEENVSILRQFLTEQSENFRMFQNSLHLQPIITEMREILRRTLGSLNAISTLQKEEKEGKPGFLSRLFGSKDERVKM